MRLRVLSSHATFSWLRRVALLLAFLGCGGSMERETPPAPAVVPGPPARDMRPAVGQPAPFVAPPAQRFKLANGISVVLAERHTTGNVHWQLSFPIGAVGDPAGKEGRTAMCMWAFLSGGAEDSQERLADMASRLHANWGLEDVRLNGFSRRQHLEATVDLFRQLWNKPGGDAWALDWTVQQLVNDLAQANADPASIAHRLFRPLAFGPQHPYGRLPTTDSYRATNSFDCAEVRRSLDLQQATLFIGGDVTASDVTRLFGTLVPRPANNPVVSVPPTAPSQARLAFVDTPGATQATILLWAPGPTVKSPEYYAADVLSAILSGGPRSRLALDLREMMGSTYSVYGGFGYYKTAGALNVYAPVAANRVRPAIEAIVRALEILRTVPVPEAELRFVRDGQIRALPVGFETIEGTLSGLRSIHHYDLALDHFDRLSSNLLRVDEAAVRMVAEAYLNPNNLRFLVVGDARVVAPALEELATTPAFEGSRPLLLDVFGRPVNR
ncbi:MAG TPA: pitrilysin family protein [Polyangia bacterium]